MVERAGERRGRGGVGVGRGGVRVEVRSRKEGCIQSARRQHSTVAWIVYAWSQSPYVVN